MKIIKIYYKKTLYFRNKLLRNYFFYKKFLTIFIFEKNFSNVFYLHQSSKKFNIDKRPNISHHNQLRFQ